MTKLNQIKKMFNNLLLQTLVKKQRVRRHAADTDGGNSQTTKSQV